MPDSEIKILNPMCLSEDFERNDKQKCQYALVKGPIMSEKQK